MPHDVNPNQGDLATARASVEGVLAACEGRLPTERTLSVALCWSDDPVLVEVLAGAGGACLGPERVEVTFSSRTEEWTAAVGWMAAYHYGRAWTRQRLPEEACVFWWQELLESAVGHRLADELAEGYEPAWNDIEEAVLTAWWPEVREGIGRQRDRPLFDDVPDPEPATVDVAAAIVDRYLPAAYATVLERQVTDSRELSAFPELTRSDVIEVLDRWADRA